MKTKFVLLAWLMVCVVPFFQGCGPGGERCRKCGMPVAQYPRWVAGLTNAAGQEERFCCERCMFAHWRSPQGAGKRDAWVTEYYTQKRMPVSEVFFVAGSDVTGPMGRALVPVSGREAAERFLKDHHGSRLYTADEITLEVLREIADPVPGDRAAAKRDTHAHDSRHGGTLVVLGDEEYHLELVHNRPEGLLQVYVFDGHIDNFVRLPDEGFDLLAWPDGRETRLRLKAVRTTPEGKAVTETALFEARADWLRGVTRFRARLPELAIRGQRFTDVEFEFPAGNLERPPE